MRDLHTYAEHIAGRRPLRKPSSTGTAVSALNWMGG
jgi:hypothetical protein